MFNEEDTVELFYKAIRGYEPLKKYQIEIVFVNDGSIDNTESIINKLSEYDSFVKALSFTRNFGKESALFAGLKHATGDAVIPIDVDLQDPIEVLPKLIHEWEQGYDIVLAKRIDRSSDGYLKRTTAELFYRLHNKISNIKIEENVGDFRLLDKAIVNEILQMPERNLFMKGLLSWTGGKTTIINYSRAERMAGKTKFNGWKL